MPTATETVRVYIAPTTEDLDMFRTAAKTTVERLNWVPILGASPKTKPVLEDLKPTKISSQSVKASRRTQGRTDEREMIEHHQHQ